MGFWLKTFISQWNFELLLANFRPLAPRFLLSKYFHCLHWGTESHEIKRFGISAASLQTYSCSFGTDCTWRRARQYRNITIIATEKCFSWCTLLVLYRIRIPSLYLDRAKSGTSTSIGTAKICGSSYSGYCINVLRLNRRGCWKTQIVGVRQWPQHWSHS